MPAIVPSGGNKIIATNARIEPIIFSHVILKNSG